MAGGYCTRPGTFPPSEQRWARMHSKLSESKGCRWAKALLLENPPSSLLPFPSPAGCTRLHVLRAPWAPTLCHRACDSWELWASPPSYKTSQPCLAHRGAQLTLRQGTEGRGVRGPRVRGTKGWLVLLPCLGPLPPRSAFVDTAGGFLWAALQGWEGWGAHRSGGSSCLGAGSREDHPSRQRETEPRPP